MSTTRTRRLQQIDESPLTVGDIVKRLLPYGTRLARRPHPWQACPEWAADVFAAAAAIVQASSCYAEPGIALSRNERDRKEKLERAELHIRIGKSWARSVVVPELVRTHWATLLQSYDLSIADTSRRAEKWKRAALALVAISDEAFSGAGYFPSEDDGIANYIWDELIKADGRHALQLPHSMCLLVPNEIACVLPKSLTPNVGCTLRSLTHNVAFLPGRGIVKPEWLINPGDEISSRIRRARSGKKRPVLENAPDGVFNVLLVPFPYVIHAVDFSVSRHAGKNRDGYFTLSQGWLRNGQRPISPKAMAQFIGDLVENAKIDVGPIHAVVLPEGALNEEIGDGAAKILARRFHELELLVSGEMIGETPTQRNVAAHYRLLDGEVVTSLKQSKHHRWRLEENQIRQYQLGGILDPNHSWWEDIDVHDRHIGFAINLHGAIISALVCEDLARQEPVLPTVAAVGPTLVIALLLDGPQLPNRWPGRYATVLAEDPGSSVLTITSSGMIERSAMPASDSRTVVGLWKDGHTSAKELVLPKGHHGIVLSLNCYQRRQVSLDHRVAAKPVVEYRLGATRAVQLDNAPKWLERRAGSG